MISCLAQTIYKETSERTKQGKYMTVENYERKTVRKSPIPGGPALHREEGFPRDDASKSLIESSLKPICNFVFFQRKNNAHRAHWAHRVARIRKNAASEGSRIQPKTQL